MAQVTAGCARTAFIEWLNLEAKDLLRSRSTS
jgi:hypothetical protein